MFSLFEVTLNFKNMWNPLSDETRLETMAHKDPSREISHPIKDSTNHLDHPLILHLDHLSTMHPDPPSTMHLDNPLILHLSNHSNPPHNNHSPQLQEPMLLDR